MATMTLTDYRFETYTSKTALKINTFGTYTFDNVYFDGSGTYEVENAVTATTCDSYTGTSTFVNMDTETGVGQSFTGDGNVLGSARFSLQKVGSPTGAVYAELYAHSGTYGTSSVPTGSALATSESIDASTLTGTFVDYYFDFATQYTVTNSTNYVIVLRHLNGDASNYVRIEYDATSPSHGGNYCEYTGSWSADSGRDLYFYVYTDSLVVLALTNGSTSLSASDVNESSTGRTVIQNNVNITITVKDATGTAIENAQTAVYQTSDNAELMNEDTNVSGIATESFNYSSDTPIYIRVRKSSTGTRYTPFSGTGTITSTGFSATVTLYEDTVAS